jgi:predicted MPP superfamily phosphohydrolase
LAACALLGALLLAYAYFIEPRRLVATLAEVKVKDLDPAFDGLKIVAIGDIHGGSNWAPAERIREVVELANAQQPDLVVLLGDYISQQQGTTYPRPLKMSMAEVAANLGGLKAKYGVYAVLGNHDHWFGEETIAARLREQGFTVLENEVATLQVNGKPLRLLGLKDHLFLGDEFYKDADLRRSLVANGEGQIIVLEHSPDVITYLTGVNSISPDLRLMLAAHTHGGQVALPLIGRPVVPSAYGQLFAYGEVRVNGVDLFVTSGVGTSVLPIRLGVPPEIAVLTLRSEPSTAASP